MVLVCLQFYLPIMEPAMTSLVTVQVLNKNAVDDDLVSTVYFDYKDIKAAQVAQMQQWGVKVPQITGNAGIRAPPSKKKGIRKIFTYVSVMHSMLSAVSSVVRLL